MAAESWRQLNSGPSLPSAITTSMQGALGEKGEEIRKREGTERGCVRVSRMETDTVKWRWTEQVGGG